MMRGFVSRAGVLGELMRFLLTRKRWWLIPMIIALIAFMGLIVAASTGVLSPFIYSLL